jgi:UDPglucose 6-dehydrogenase
LNGAERSLSNQETSYDKPDAMNGTINIHQALFEAVDLMRKKPSSRSNMKVSVLGAGYVGLVTGLCLADMGKEVVCFDKIQDRVDALNDGLSPIHEKGLDGLLKKHLRTGRFQASCNINDIKDTNVTFICVGTPSRKDGSLDLSNVVVAVEDIAGAIKSKKAYHVIALKSTVPPGTVDGIVIPEMERCSGKKRGKGFGVVSNPEFLREGSAVEDFRNPDRIVIGTDDARARSVMLALYSEIESPVVLVTPSAAEMIKLASNAFLAARISLINEVGNICKTLDIDVREVAHGVGLDKRIGPDFLRAGCGFGGSCFPKDVRGLSALAREKGIEPVILDGLLKVNEAQPIRMIQLLEKHMSIEGKSIGVLGLAFKPFTDDIREAPSLKIVRELLSRGAKVMVHDYQAMDNFRREIPEVRFCKTPQECIELSDAVLLVTEWPGYATPSLYEDKLIIDGRGAIRTRNYEGICW